VSRRLTGGKDEQRLALCFCGEERKRKGSWSLRARFLQLKEDKVAGSTCHRPTASPPITWCSGSERRVAHVCWTISFSILPFY
jgi:hypothetical protein